MVNVKDIVPACDTNAQGDMIRKAILAELSARGSVEVSFEGVTNATSSFVNSAFVDLLADYPFAEIKRRVAVIRVHRQIAQLIRSRMEFESKRVPHAA